MSLEHLLAALREDGRAQAEERLARGREEARRLAAEAQAARDARRKERLGALEAKLGTASRARETEARRAGLARVLDARERLLDRVFDAAARRLREAAARERARPALPWLLSSALAYTGDLPPVVTCAEGPEPKADIPAGVRGGAGSAGGGEPAALPWRRDPDLGAGVRVETEDGSIVVDATLEGRLARRRSRLQIEVLRRLGECP